VAQETDHEDQEEECPPECNLTNFKSKFGILCLLIFLLLIYPSPIQLYIQYSRRGIYNQRGKYNQWPFRGFFFYVKIFFFDFLLFAS
jgi:hypothetical protein